MKDPALQRWHPFCWSIFSLWTTEVASDHCWGRADLGRRPRNAKKVELIIISLEIYKGMVIPFPSAFLAVDLSVGLAGKA